MGCVGLWNWGMDYGWWGAEGLHGLEGTTNGR